MSNHTVNSDFLQDRYKLSLAQLALAKEVADYIKENISENFTVSDLADKFNVSKSHLQNTIRGVYGQSVYSYIKNLKMKTAAEYLCNTDKSVLEIAVVSGYSNASKFSSAFKAVMGETPLDYRKIHNIE